MVSKIDIEERLKELQKQREEAERIAKEFCQEHITKLGQNDFNSDSFLGGLKKLNEQAFELAMEFLIRTKDSFWQDLSSDELRSFIDFVITTNWFKKNETWSKSWKRDYFECVSKNTNGVGVLSDVYKSNIKTNSGISRYTADELANTTNGRAELINLLKISDPEIQYLALYALASNCIKEHDYSVHGSEERLLYINAVRDFIFHQENKLSEIAITALHRAKLLQNNEIIKIMEVGGSGRTLVGIESLSYLEIDPSKTNELFSLIVKALESHATDISNAALKGVAHLSREFPNKVSNEILDALIIRTSNYPKEFFNTTVVTSALRETFKYNPRLPGKILHRLCEVAYSSSIDVRNRAVFVAMALNKKEFLALVNEKRESNPSIAREILNTVNGTLDTDQIVQQISQTAPEDIQQNAANQITVLAKYYENGLSQAKVSFNWAIAMTIFSILSFVVAVSLFVNSADKTGTVIAAVGGTLTQLIAGTLLLIYRQTLVQLDNYTQQMNKVQNYLLANSFIESLSGGAKESARMELIKTLSANSN